MQVAAILLVGARPEPYLEAVLKGLEGAVDRLVVNDNSGQPLSLNRRVIEASALFAEGRVEIVSAPFEGFARARNLCLEAVRAQAEAETWVFMVDADEVHGRGLVRLTRRVLPALRSSVGGLDGYVVQFMQTFEYFISVDRRHNLFYRLGPEVRYEREVHERLRGVRGRVVCLPYTYHHYGYIRPNGEILEKWRLYSGLGDRSYSDEMFANGAYPAMFVDQAPLCIPYAGRLPAALVATEALSMGSGEEVGEFVREVEAYLRQPRARRWALLRRLNYRLRALGRLFEALLWLRNPLRWGDVARLALDT